MPCGRPESSSGLVRRQPDLDPERLVFIDETGASTKMARRHGRAPRSERLRTSVPHGHRRATTFVGAPRLSGMTAPMGLDRAMTGTWFLAYVEQVLSPTQQPGDIGTFTPTECANDYKAAGYVRRDRNLL